MICPQCNHHLDDPQNHVRLRPPQIGNFAVCYYCCTVVVFDQAGGEWILRLPTMAERASIAANPVMQRLQQMLQTIRGHPRNLSFALNFSWLRSLPLDWQASLPDGGLSCTEVRAMQWQGGKLYAGCGVWMDPHNNVVNGPVAQVLRLDGPSSPWVQEKTWYDVTPTGGNRNFSAVAGMKAVTFTIDSQGNPIAPVDCLFVGFFNRSATALYIAQRVAGVWSEVFRTLTASTTNQIRAFGFHTDTVTGIQMAFAGSDNDGIFSGVYDSTAHTVVWSAGVEPGSFFGVTTSGGIPGRYLAFAECNNQLFATIYGLLIVRTDGVNPHWSVAYSHPGAQHPNASGLRGLTTVPNLHGDGQMLIAFLENGYLVTNSANYVSGVYAIQPTPPYGAVLELNAGSWLKAQFGANVNYVIGAYNDMPLFPVVGGRLIGLNCDPQNLNPGAYFLLRKGDGTYSRYFLQDPAHQTDILYAVRCLSPSQFPSDVGTALYAGGYDAHAVSSHNTGWIYKGRQI